MCSILMQTGVQVVRGCTLSLPKDDKDLTKVSHIFKYWNGHGLEPIKTETGEGIKKVRINGKRNKVYSIQGPHKFK
jgi:hypothetical protein